MKKRLALVMVLMMALMAFGCAKEAPAEAPKDDDWSYIEAKGKMIVGITEYAPMNYYDDDGTLIGFDTEFTNALCAKLGVEPEFVVIDWGSKELELANKNIDCIWNGLTVTEERKANMDFSTSYLKNEQVVVIQEANKDTFTDAASLAGKTVAAESGSAGATAVAADLPDSELVEVKAQSDALLEVKAGTAAAAVIDVTMATAMTGEGSDYAELIISDNFDMLDEEYAIGFRVGSTVVAKANEAIAALQADGTLAQLAAKYEVENLLIK